MQAAFNRRVDLDLDLTLNTLLISVKAEEKFRFSISCKALFRSRIEELSRPSSGRILISKDISFGIDGIIHLLGYKKKKYNISLMV